MPQQSPTTRRTRRALALAVAGLLVPLVAPATATAASDPTGGAPVTVDVMTLVDGRAQVSTRTAPTPAAADRLVDRLEADPRVAAADVATSYRVSATPARGAATRRTGAVGLKATSACVRPGTDPYLGCAVHLPAINAPAAWATTTGAGTTVAVLDTGVDATAPDLVGQVTTGPNYAPGTDLGEHGTWVSTVVAGIRGNTYGAVGVAPASRVLSVRVCSADGCDSAAVAKGIVYAADAGVQVVNLSLGGDDRSSVTEQAVNYALSKGVVVVASAGNSGDKGNAVEYPAALPGVISVAATTADGGAVTTWTQHNDAVDLSAPGEQVAAGGPKADGYAYVPVAGTSFSAPMVSAAAALVRSVNSGLSPAQVETLLESTVQVPAGWPTSGYGTGVLDVAAAVASAGPVATVAPVPRRSRGVRPPAS